MTERARRGRTGFCALALACALVVAASRGALGEERGRITSVRRGVVYVDLGSIDGVRVGDELRTAGGSTLVVTVIGERQLTAKAKGSVAAGQRVTPPDRPREVTVERRPARDLPPPQRYTESDVQRVHEALMVQPLQRVRFDARREERTAPQTTVHGDLSLLYLGVVDTDPQARRDLDLHSVRLRSRLDVDHIGGLPLRWQHDIGARGDFGPDLGSRPGSRSRPWVQARRASIAWGRRGDPFSAQAGRMPMLLPAQGGLLDGAELSVGLGAGASIGLFGGLSPDLLDTYPSADVGRFGLVSDWSGDFGASWLSLSASLSGSTWLGSLDRTALTLSTSGAVDSLVSWFGDVVLDAYPDHNPQGRPVVDPSSAFVGVHTQPLPWMFVDAHYSFFRDVATRELLALLPEADGLPPLTDPRQTAWVLLGFEPLPLLTVSQSAGLGFGNEWSEGLSLRTRVDVSSLPVIETGVHASYVFNQSPVARVQSGSLVLSQPVAEPVRIHAGYTFTTSQLRRLDERYDQHAVDGGVEVWLATGFTADATATVLLDESLGTTVMIAGYGSWRF